MVQSKQQWMNELAVTHVTFMQRPWVQSVLPFAVSLAFHLGIVVFAISVYRVATHTTFHTEMPGFVEAVDYTAVECPIVFTGKVGERGKDIPRLGNSDILDQDSPTFKPTESKVLAGTIGKGLDTDADTGMIGIGPRHGVSGNIGGLGDDTVGLVANHRIGRSDDLCNGNGEFITCLRNLSPRVVFVCDASGSMQSVFGGLKREVQTAINNLPLGQAFNVIFFSDDKVLTLNPQGLMLATEANKHKSAEFLSDITPHGQTNPLPAIRAAFAQKPELIFVLTDGFDQVDSLESVYNEFATLNKDGKVRVNTILIGTGEQKELVAILKRIAADNRGTMKVVSRDAF